MRTEQLVGPPLTLAAAAAATVALILAGCAGGPSNLTQRAGGHVLWTPAHEPEMHMQMAIEGELGVTESGCFTVVPVPPVLTAEQMAALDDETREAFFGEPELGPVEFPFGTTLSEDGQSVNIPGLGDVAIGEPLTGGGGHIDLTAQDDADAFFEDVPPECVADGVLIFSSAP